MPMWRPIAVRITRPCCNTPCDASCRKVKSFHRNRLRRISHRSFPSQRRQRWNTKSGMTRRALKKGTMQTGTADWSKTMSLWKGSEARARQAIGSRIAGAPLRARHCRRSSWRTGWDSNPRRACTLAGFQDRCIQPLCHSSVLWSRNV